MTNDDDDEKTSSVQDVTETLGLGIVTQRLDDHGDVVVVVVHSSVKEKHSILTLVVASQGRFEVEVKVMLIKRSAKELNNAVDVELIDPADYYDDKFDCRREPFVAFLEVVLLRCGVGEDE